MNMWLLVTVYSSLCVTVWSQDFLEDVLRNVILSIRGVGEKVLSSIAIPTSRDLAVGLQIDEKSTYAMKSFGEFVSTCPPSLPPPNLTGLWFVTYANRKWLQSFMVDLDEIEWSASSVCPACKQALLLIDGAILFDRVLRYLSQRTPFLTSYIHIDAPWSRKGVLRTMEYVIMPRLVCQRENFVGLCLQAKSDICDNNKGDSSEEKRCEGGVSTVTVMNLQSRDVLVINALADNRYIPIRRPVSSLFRSELPINCLTIEFLNNDVKSRFEITYSKNNKKLSVIGDVFRERDKSLNMMFGPSLRTQVIVVYTTAYPFETPYDVIVLGELKGFPKCENFLILQRSQQPSRILQIASSMGISFPSNPLERIRCEQNVAGTTVIEPLGQSRQSQILL